MKKILNDNGNGKILLQMKMIEKIFYQMDLYVQKLPQKILNSCNHLPDQPMSNKPIIILTLRPIYMAEFLPS
jgi:hypothetical protein